MKASYATTCIPGKPVVRYGQLRPRVGQKVFIYKLFLTSMFKTIGLSIGVAMCAATLMPSLAAAQTSGNGLLSVYVQVANPSNATMRNPGDFNVLVAGQSPSPSTFWGSQTGTQVSLGVGTYSVAISGNQWGYTPSYSQGCTGTIASGQTALCIVTMSAQYNNYAYPLPYPYPYTTPSLKCSPSTQTAGLGQSVSFTAVGGVGGTYNWMIPGRNYPNVGPVLTVSFDSTGSQLVTVTNASQTATCVVNINNSYYPVYPTTSTIYPINTVYPITPILYPTYTQVYPQLPNTGVEPLSLAQMALALALLAGAALLAVPYVRKAFAIATY